MTGKIFKESSNIYEDEARILFDYYKKAAEKIVEEEINLEATGKVRSRRHLYDSLCIRMRQREANRGVHRDLFVSFSPIFH